MSGTITFMVGNNSQCNWFFKKEDGAQIMKIRSLASAGLFSSALVLCCPAFAQAPATPRAVVAPPTIVAGIPVNYDEAKVGTYTQPDPLVLRVPLGRLPRSRIPFHRCDDCAPSARAQPCVVAEGWARPGGGSGQPPHERP